MLGMVEQGINNDPCDEMSTQEIEEHYGCFGKEKVRRTHQTGAGHNNDKDEDITVDVDNSLPSVKVKSTRSPFPNDATQELFRQALKKAVKEALVPEGYRVLEDEWEDGEYPAFEMLQVGKKRSGETVIPLPQEVWLPRAELWATALALKAEILNVM